MKTNTVLLVALLLLCFASLSISGWVYFSRSKFGYVRSQELVSRFRGTIEAKKKFEAIRNQLIANGDSMEVSVANAKRDYLNFYQKMSPVQRSEQEKNLQFQEQQLFTYRSAIDSRMQEEDDIIMSGVLGQVNSFVEQYAKEGNYDLILGTTTEGSLLYARPEMDLTEELIKEINIKYQGK